MASRDSGHVLWSEDELKVLPIPTVSVALRVVVRSGHGSLSKFVVSRQNLALRRRTLLLVCIVLIYLSILSLIAICVHWCRISMIDVRRSFFELRV